MANIYRLKVDLKLKQTGIVPTFVQYDTARLEFQIFDNGKVLDLSGYTSVEFAHKKPDGSVIVGVGTIETDPKGNKIVAYDYQGSEMSKEGVVETSFSLIGADNKKLSIQTFKVKIVTDLREGVFDPANPEYSKLQEYSVQMESLIAQGNEAKEMRFVNAYNASTAYKKNNTVTLNGESYIAKQANTNKPPTGLDNDPYWSVLARKGQDGTGTVVRHREEFISTSDQKVFNLKNSYDQFQNRVDVEVGGVPQFSPANFTETTAKSITLSEPIPAGIRVIITYFSQAVPLKTDLEAVVNGHTSRLNDNNNLLTQQVDKIAQVSQQLAEKSKEIESVASHNKTPKGRKFDRPFTTFVTDDADKQDKITMLPIFRRQGVPFCTGAVPLRIETWSNVLSIEELKELEAEGHEILSHSYTHSRLPTLTDAQLEDEMKLSKEYLNSRGLNVKNFVTPYGEYNDKVKLAAQKYFRSMRISAGYYNNKPIESFELKGVWIENNATVSGLSGYPRNSFEHYKYFIDQAYSTNSWLIISTHSWEIQSWGFEDLLEQIVAYAKTKSEILTVNQALDRLDNIMESALFSKSQPYVPHFAVSPDGVVDSNLSFFKNLPVNSVKANTPLSYFDNLTVSICNIQTSSANGFPSNTAGVLETHKFIPPESENDFGYAYQVYKLLNSENVYKRTAKSDGTWGEFYLDSYKDNKISVTQLSSTHTPSDLKPNHITTWGYNNSEAASAGLPEGKAGTLFAYSFGHYSNDPAYYHEIYHLRNSTTRYIRSGSSATAWGAWYNPNDLAHQLVITKARGSYTGDTAPQDYAKGKVIKSAVAANTASMPSTASGLLTIDTTGLVTGGATDWGYMYQEYRKYNSNEVWTRPAASATTWGAWQKITMV